MATMGRRKIAGTKGLSNPADKPFVGIGHMPINLIIDPIQIKTVATQDL